MICCEEYIDLGCFNSCQPLNFGEAIVDGIYTILLEFNEVVTKYDKTFELGEDLLFDIEINENYRYVGKLIMPNNTEFCFKFKSKIYL
jgi:hypothetical protein